ncbi:MAG: enoyl-CoA hydratase/isomerase family protein, partial [Spongiibacteraceae bacterium]
MSRFETVEYAVTKRVATILLNRPRARNAFNVPLRRDLLAAIELANNDDDVRVVVITGAGEGFCAGADLTEGYEGYDKVSGLILAEYKPFILAIEQSQKLYISAINGAAAGIGSALAMCCDLTVMGESAYIYQAFAPIGLVPDGGASWQLVNAIGYKRAIAIIVEGGKIPAAECVSLGLANKVVADEELRSAAQNWAEKLALGAPLAQRYSKQLARRSMEQSLEQAIDSEAYCQDIC